jgi:hypothetical protein
MIEYDIRSAKHTIEKEQKIYKHKLLNDEENEITRKAAQELYDEYLKMSPKARRDKWV